MPVALPPPIGCLKPLDLEPDVNKGEWRLEHAGSFASKMGIIEQAATIQKKVSQPRFFLILLPLARVELT